MKVLYRYTAALIASVGVVGLTLWWRGSGDAPAAPPPASPVPTASAAALRAATASQATLAGAAAAGPTAPPTIDDYEDNPIGDILQRILAGDPQLAAFMYFHNRPLLDPANTVKFHELLSDPATFAIVQHDLLYPEESKTNQEGSIKRLMKIDYLRDALTWKENPRRGELITLVSDTLLTDNYPPGMGMDMRLSLSGNKQELYQLLYEIDPARAAAAVTAARGTRLEPMLGYLATSLEQRKRVEATLETEVPL